MGDFGKNIIPNRFFSGMAISPYCVTYEGYGSLVIESVNYFRDGLLSLLSAHLFQRA